MKCIHSVYRKIVTAFHNLPLKKKLILIYVLAFVIPVLSIMIYSTHGILKLHNEKETTQNQAQCNQICTNTRVKLINFYESVLSFSNSPAVTSYFENKYPSATAFFNTYPKVTLHITSFLTSHPQASKLVIYTDNPTFITNNASIKKMTPEIKEHYDLLCSSSDMSSPIISDVRTTASGIELNLGSRISFIKTPKYQSLLFLSYPEDILYSFYKCESEKLSIYLASPSGIIVSSSDRNCIGSNIADNELIQQLESSSLDDSVLTEIEKNHYYVSSFPEAPLLNGWKLYIKISNESYQAEINALMQKSLFLVTLFSLTGLFLYFLCSASITRRLDRLVTTMSNIHNDEMLDPIPGTEFQDEIGTLAKNFDKMIKRIKKLIYDVYTSNLQVKDLELKNKQAQLLALQSQINPHFLFNTMQSLSISCYNNDDYETAAYINKFCVFLRDCLYWETKCVPLSEEIRVAENYLSLQKLRFQEALDYEIHIPDAISEVPIPKFTLQPIVENAIEHGMESHPQKQETTCVRITAIALSDKKIEIQVEDNGAGIDAEHLKELNAKLADTQKDPKAESIGIFNTNERLRLFYGPQYGLTLEGCKGSGTRVTITIASSIT